MDTDAKTKFTPTVNLKTLYKDSFVYVTDRITSVQDRLKLEEWIVL